MISGVRHFSSVAPAFTGSQPALLLPEWPVYCSDLDVPQWRVYRLSLWRECLLLGSTVFSDFWFVTYRQHKMTWWAQGRMLPIPKKGTGENSRSKHINDAKLKKKMQTWWFSKKQVKANTHREEQKGNCFVLVAHLNERRLKISNLHNFDSVIIRICPAIREWYQV